jgi:hypothetical protein
MMTLRRVWQRGFQDSGAASNAEGVFCDIDTDINGVSHPVECELAEREIKGLAFFS